MTGSALYVGTVTHHRWKPKRHHLRYGVFALLADLDELPDLVRRLRLFSHNRFNLFALMDRDFGAGDGTALRPWVEAQLAQAGLETRGIRISLLCYPRILGYAFNPLSVFYCRRARDGALIAILYEVHNTFGERHCYLIPTESNVESNEAPVRQACEKAFHVSPFICMQATYRFQILPPSRESKTGDRLAIVINETDSEGPLLDASFVASRVPLSDGKLLSLLARHPLMGLKVIGGIHWEALRLWLKGIALTNRPAPPVHLVTIVERARDDDAQTFRPAA
jgi:DUF1365 family protein